MSAFHQEGGCSCGDVRYTLSEEPLSIYACHCTDCQTETGSAFYLAVVVKRAALDFGDSELDLEPYQLPDGRIKGAWRCRRCRGPLGGPSAIETLASIDGGTFDDTSWIRPAGHIWTRSAQPWIGLAEDAIQFEGQPSEEEFVSLVRHYRSRST